MKLTAGKRYWFYINNYDNRCKSGLFTGEYDEHNGNALLMTKDGEQWSIRPNRLFTRIGCGKANGRKG